MMRTRRCLGPARRRINNLLYGTGPARLRHAGRPRFVPADCRAALTRGSVDQVHVEKRSGACRVTRLAVHQWNHTTIFC